MTYASAVSVVLTVAIAALAAGTVCCLIRAVIGPTAADRLVAANMTGTQVVCLICLIAGRNGEGGFADIAVVYALLSLLAGVVFTKLLTGKDRKP